MKIKFLQAFNGDSILISYIDLSDTKKNILIDGGTGNTYQFKSKKGKPEPGSLGKEIERIKRNDEHVDLLILTHVDDDHIGGLLKWFETDPTAKEITKEVWFNSGRIISEHFKEEEIKDNLISLRNTGSLETSIKQGIAFEDYIEENNIWDRQLVSTKTPKVVDQLSFTFLSPNIKKLKYLLRKWEKEDTNLDTSRNDDYGKSLMELINEDIFKEDSSIHNGSSIAFILSYNEKNLIFLGDAHPSVIVEELKALNYSSTKPIKAEFLKVSHHGSKANTNYELLELIDTKKYVISSNGNIHNLPDKQCLARIINHNKNSEIFFNYPDKVIEIFTDIDSEEFPDFKAVGIDSVFTI